MAIFVAIVDILWLQKKSPKESAPKIKKISVTNFELFFLWPHDKIQLWSQIIDFPKVF